MVKFSKIIILGIAVALTETEALQRVKNLPEVKKYFLQIPKAQIEVDNDSPKEWLIHVYEVKDHHTATMNWFRVNKKSGKIKKMF